MSQAKAPRQTPNLMCYFSYLFRNAKSLAASLIKYGYPIRSNTTNTMFVCQAPLRELNYSHPSAGQPTGMSPRLGSVVSTPRPSSPRSTTSHKPSSSFNWESLAVQGPDDIFVPPLTTLPLQRQAVEGQFQLPETILHVMAACFAKLLPFIAGCDSYRASAIWHSKAI